MRKLSFFLLATVFFAALISYSVPSLAATDWETGVSAFQVGDHEQAAEAFGRYVEQVPNAYQGHQMLGISLMRSGNIADAISSLRRADELKPAQPNTVLSLAQALIATNKNEDACAALSSLAADQVDRGSKKALLTLRAKAECEGDGITALEELARTANDARSWAAYGGAAMRASQLAEATAAFDKAAALEPKNVKLRKALAAVLVRQAEAAEGNTRASFFRQAVEPAQAAYELDAASGQADGDTTRLYAEVLLGAGNYEQANGLLHSAVPANPAIWQFRYLLGKTLILQNKDALATAELTHALKLTNTDSETQLTHQQLGFALERQKKFDDAIVAYQLAGNGEAVTRVRENQKIAEANLEAEVFNERRRVLIEEQRQRQKLIERARLGGPPPPPQQLDPEDH